MTITIKKARCQAGLNKHFSRNSTARLAVLLVAVALAYASIATLLCVAAPALIGGAR